MSGIGSSTFRSITNDEVNRWLVQETSSPYDINLFSAASLNDFPLSTTAPTNGQTLTYNSTSGVWEPTAPGGSGTVTSVTLNLGTTGLLTSAAATQTITNAGTFTITGTLIPANGGTGTTITPNSGEVLLGTNGGIYAPTGATADGQLLIGTKGAGFTATTLTEASKGGIEIVDAAASITIGVNIQQTTNTTGMKLLYWDDANGRFNFS